MLMNYFIGDSLITPPFNFWTRTPEARLKAGFWRFKKRESALETRFEGEAFFAFLRPGFDRGDVQ
jgi:hypothetical protein